MKLINAVPLLLILFLSCKDSPKKIKAESEPAVTAEHSSFFPVTDYLYGQITEIKNRGINPIKITTLNGHEDSVWLKVEDLNKEFAPFLSPVIDSSFLAGLFTEKRFLDQTIDAYTFTYDPIKTLPDSFSLQRMDIYVDPRSSMVKRIYLLKKSPDHKILHLTWQSNKSCKIVIISNDHVEKEVTIKWDF